MNVKVATLSYLYSDSHVLVGYEKEYHDEYTT